MIWQIADLPKKKQICKHERKKNWVNKNVLRHPPKKYPLFAPHKNSFLCDNCDSPAQLVVVPCNEFSYFFAFFSFGGRKSTSVASGGDGGIQSLFPRILTHLGSCTSTTYYLLSLWSTAADHTVQARCTVSFWVHRNSA